MLVERLQVVARSVSARGSACRSSCSASFSPSSGCPISTICSSLSVSVSRFESRRTCSSTCGQEPVLAPRRSQHASSYPADACSSRNLFRISVSSSDCPARRISANSTWSIFFRSSTGFSGGLNTNASVRVVRIDLLEQIAADRGLARADFARNHHEPAAVLNTEEQVREGLLVLVAQVEQVRRVRREVEGPFFQAVKRPRT